MQQGLVVAFYKLQFNLINKNTITKRKENNCILY